METDFLEEENDDAGEDGSGKYFILVNTFACPKILLDFLLRRKPFAHISNQHRKYIPCRTNGKLMFILYILRGTVWRG